ncbi:MAG TPA: TIGR03009 domain-containing protein [Gemmataceae bacterium]|nr:TIGR03009 domain-containing protein [Gemmataceae bacterium]
MRIAGCTVASLLIAAPLIAQQQPARPNLTPAGQKAAAIPTAVPSAAPALNPNDPLDTLLLQWEHKMKSVESLYAKCVRTETDPLIANKIDEYAGWAKFQRPSRAHLYMEKKSNPQIFERYLSTGTFLYEYRPQNQLLRIHELPQRGPGQGPVEDNFLSFLFGIEAREAKRRYEINLVKTDANYHYLLIKPRFPQDKAEFSEARLVLWVTNLLPRQMEFIQPNGARVKWDIPQLDTTVRFSAADFQPPPAGKGWNTVKVPPPGTQPAGMAPPAAPGNPPPTKVRPSGP